MTEIPTLYKGIIPDEYKYNITKSRINFTNDELPALPTLSASINVLDMSILSNTAYPYYVCEKVIEYYNNEDYTPSIIIQSYSIGVYTFMINVNLDANYEKYFRFVRLRLSISSNINVQNNYMDGNVSIRLRLNVTCGSNYQCGATTNIKTLSPGQNATITEGYYYYDFIYDTRLNSLKFEKKVF